MTELVFTIEGTPPSGNRTARISGDRLTPYTPANVREYRERIASVTMAEMRRQRFKMPDYVSLDVTAYNVRQDCDNLVAEVQDGMQGLAFAYDSRIIDLRVRKRKDKAGARLTIRVAAVDGKEAGYQ